MNGHAIAAWAHNGWLQLQDLTTQKGIEVNLRAESVMDYDGRIYYKADDSIFELEFTKLNGSFAVVPRTAANAMAKATRMFDGVAIHDMLGTWYASLFPQPKSSYQIRLRELEGYRIVDAKYDNHVLMVVGVKRGVYDRFIFLLHSGYQDYTLRVDKDIVYAGLNFIVLENGVCAHICEDEKLELFVNNHMVPGVKIIHDKALSCDMRLFKRGTDVVFAEGATLYKLSTRKR
jgi:hypothetical protein